jgi:hypothetical protein
MQTDILLKQLYSALADLKGTIEKFEKHPSPSTQYTEQLHGAIYQANKLVSAYLVLKEHKDVSPDINIHLKLMNVPAAVESENVIESLVEPEQISRTFVIEKQAEPIEENRIENTVLEIQEAKNTVVEFQKITVNINDKFRFLNDLFASNVNEYNIAMEQINTTTNLQELINYLNGLKMIYSWDDANEVVKKLYVLAAKRFS